ncbi:MAG TPA: aminopeptidase [Candidatus Limnocylindrales bacterium]|nr:aminopeptidase [Candidatus Limnocylindrales bacterium]
MNTPSRGEVRSALAGVLAAALWSAGTAIAAEPAGPLPWPEMAARIAGALRVAPGERVLLRVDPATMPELEPAVRAALEADGAVVDRLEYGPAPDLEARLAHTDIYVWLPAPQEATPLEQGQTLARWLDGGPGRELHFHWVDGTRDVDGLPAPHTPAYDRVYVDALDIDYRRLGERMDRAIERLRGGEVHVTTPAGTDVRFRIGDRPFNKQDGDASKARAERARIRIDRHVELPAGVMRVAPIEESVAGVLVLPRARFGDVEATGVRLEIEQGIVVRARAETGLDAVEAFLASDPAAARFRELCLGFNPRLVVPPGESALPYYGYGAGVVRMSLGDNTELGGRVEGGTVRWFFFPDATVRAGAATLVERGRLVD